MFALHTANLCWSWFFIWSTEHFYEWFLTTETVVGPKHGWMWLKNNNNKKNSNNSQVQIPKKTCIFELWVMVSQIKVCEVREEIKKWSCENQNISFLLSLKYERETQGKHKRNINTALPTSPFLKAPSTTILITFLLQCSLSTQRQRILVSHKQIKLFYILTWSYGTFL